MRFNRKAYREVLIHQRARAHVKQVKRSINKGGAILVRKRFKADSSRELRKPEEKLWLRKIFSACSFMPPNSIIGINRSAILYGLITFP
jgi:hypothetical protein